MVNNDDDDADDNQVTLMLLNLSVLDLNKLIDQQRDFYKFSHLFFSVIERF